MNKMELHAVDPRMPMGFSMSGVACGIKRVAGKLDLALIRSDQPCTAVGVYTQNQVVAAPVLLDRERTPSDRVIAVVVNAGNANACTGQQGMDDARAMARYTAQVCSCDETAVLVMSTGIIGEFLPMEKIQRGIRTAADSLERSPAALQRAAEGILTTDKGTKISCRQIRQSDRVGSVTGIAKGAGMIAPHMATMLSVIMTDIAIPLATADTVFRRVIEDSFNAMVVDGHTSTNDTAILLSSGAAGWSLEDPEVLATVLGEVCAELAYAIADDGEGATHVLAIRVCGCDRNEDARRIARAIGCSPLVKTAIAGNDPNWGRIVSAAGYAGVCLEPHRITLTLNDCLLFRDGQPIPFDAAAVSRTISANRKVEVDLRVGEGNGQARFWASDLTAEYVRINADYHT